MVSFIKFCLGICFFAILSIRSFLCVFVCVGGFLVLRFVSSLLYWRSNSKDFLFCLFVCVIITTIVMMTMLLLLLWLVQQCFFPFGLGGGFDYSCVCVEMPLWLSALNDDLRVFSFCLFPLVTLISYLYLI